MFNVNAYRYGLFIGDSGTDYNSLFTALNNTHLTSFISFTGLRLRLLYPATDGTELLGQTVDLNQFFYSISDISLVAG